ncbi:MAG: hypothetical protein ACRERR_10345 [Moraxellaceae bacterium]
MKARGALLAMLFLMSAADAEERFYQVIDASGRVQTLREPAALAAPVNKAPPSPEIKKPSETAAKKSSQKEADKSKTLKVDDVAPYAAYDGDEYLDSEVMDDSHGMTKGQSKKKFYLVNDGVGQRVESMDGDAVEAQSSAASLSMMGAAEYVGLRDSYTQLSAENVSDIKSGCLSEKQLGDAVTLVADERADVVFDKQLTNYVKAGQLVEIYRIGAGGVRTVSFRSYAKTDIDQSFIVPVVAFADASGCVKRVADGYFQRYYPATSTKHAMIEASLVLHSDDVYVLLVMPGTSDKRLAFRPEYRVSSVGRVSIKWRP